jgi:hypothetical protein
LRPISYPVVLIFDMENYKFLYVFAYFKERERNAFLQFIMPAKGKVPKYFRVCEALCAHTTQQLLAAREDLKSLNIPNNIFVDVQGNPKTDFRDDMVNALSELFKQLQPFVLGDNEDLNTWPNQFRWITFLEKCGLEQEAKRLLKQVYPAVAKSGTTIKSLNDVQAALAIAQKYRNYLFATATRHDIQKISQCIDLIAALLEIIKCQTEIDQLNLLSLQKQYADEEEQKKVPTTETNVEIEIPLKDIYQEMHLMATKKEVAHYYRAKQLFQQYALELAPHEMQVILRYLANSAPKFMRALQKTKAEVANEVFELYEQAEKSGLLKLEGVLKSGLFFNVITAAVHVGKFDWANQFYKDHCGIYSEESQYKMARLKNAFFAFEKEDYLGVVDEIDKIQFSLDYDIIRAKILLMSAAYELRDSLLLRGQRRSLNEFFKHNNKILAYDGAENLGEILNLMMKKRPKKEIENAINQKKSIHSKEWLLEKLQKYKGKGD